MESDNINEPRKLDAPWRGKVWVADDFDETSEEIINLFYGEDNKKSLALLRE